MLASYVLDDFVEPWRAAQAPVVLLHPGLGGNNRLFQAWVPYLADRYRILRVDPCWLSGTATAANDWSLADFVGDVLDLLDELEIERVHWVGTSGGGIIGQAATLSAPERIASLTLIATTPRFRSPTTGLDEWLAPLDAGSVRRFFELDIPRRFGIDAPERTAWIISELERTSAEVTAALHRWVVGVDLVAELPKIGCPTLVLTGELDTLTSVDDAQLMAHAIPNAKLRILAGYPHNVAYTHPALVTPIVRRFLDEQQADAQRIGLQQAQVASELVGLDPPPERVSQLAGTLERFLAGSAALHRLDVGDREPPVITYDREARA